MSWHRVLAIFAVVALALAASAQAEAAGFRASPWEYVGAAGDCGPDAGIDTVAAAWVSGEGLPDAGKSNHALYLQKLGDTTNCAASGATINGVEGITLTAIGFDYRDDGHCGGGAPRFNVQTDTGFYFLGCAGGAQESLGNGWTRVTFDPPAGTVQSIEIVFDEGEDAGPGYVYLDNININGTLIGKPGNV